MLSRYVTNSIYFLQGYFLQIFFVYLGIDNQKEIEYYGEAHLSSYNSYIHTICMPGTILGILLWVPVIFSSTKKEAIEFHNMVFYTYIGLYCYISFLYSFFVYVLYYPSLYYANILYSNTLMKGFQGFLCMFFCLGVQEYIGHYLQGDIPSRPEGVPNAILYAPYYSVYHICN